MIKFDNYELCVVVPHVTRVVLELRLAFITLKMEYNMQDWGKVMANELH